RELSCCSWCPDGNSFAAGFADGSYAVWDSNKSAAPLLRIDRTAAATASPLSAGGEETGPYCWIRTPVISLQWVPIPRGGGGGGGGSNCKLSGVTWGLVVAGGLQIDEPSEADGVSLLLSSPPPDDGAGAGGSGSGRWGPRSRSRSHKLSRAASSSKGIAPGTPQWQAAELPLASGNERLADVRIVSIGGGGLAEGDRAVEAAAAASNWELTLVALVTSTRSVGGVGAALAAREQWADIVMCGARTAADGGFVARPPSPLPGHFSTAGAVTTVVSAGLRPAMDLVNFMSCTLEEPGRGSSSGGGSGGSTGAGDPPWLSGGGARWSRSVLAPRRDEALAVSELLVFGHADGALTFYEGSGPAAWGDPRLAVSMGIEEEGPSTLVPMGAVPLGRWPGVSGEILGGGGDGKGNGGGGGGVTAVDVLVERDHDPRAALDACFVAAGLAGGAVAVLRLGPDDGRGLPWEELLPPPPPLPPLSAYVRAGPGGAGRKASEAGSAAPDAGPGGSGGNGGVSAGSNSGGGNGNGHGNAGRRQSVDELAAVIAAAQAEARAIDGIGDGGDKAAGYDAEATAAVLDSVDCGDEDEAANAAGSGGGAAGAAGAAACAESAFAAAAARAAAWAMPSPVRMVINAHNEAVCAVMLALLGDSGGDGGGAAFALLAADVGGTVSVSRVDDVDPSTMILKT
ncbi:unnamed protein product, partial [Phaeothamnion confervicola]